MTLETPQQRDRARTIFERSQPGRRAFVAPALDVPARDGLRLCLSVALISLLLLFPLYYGWFCLLGYL